MPTKKKKATKKATKKKVRKSSRKSSKPTFAWSCGARFTVQKVGNYIKAVDPQDNYAFGYYPIESVIQTANRHPHVWFMGDGTIGGALLPEEVRYTENGKRKRAHGHRPINLSRLSEVAKVCQKVLNHLKIEWRDH